MLISEQPIIELFNKQETENLRIPKLMPDEYLLGFAGRVASLNFYKNMTFFHQFIARHTHNKLAIEVPILISLSKLLNTDPMVLWKKHTVYSIKTRENTDKSFLEKLNISHDSTRNKKDVMSFMPTYFCSECVKNDLSKYGFSYWRKVHQELESNHCKMHPKQKLFTAIENKRLFFSPAWHIENETFKMN